MDEEIDAHEDPNDVQGEVGEGVVEGDSDDAEKDEAGEGADHDGLGGTGSTKGGFHDNGGGKGWLEDSADEDEGNRDGDELGGLGVGFGKNEADDDLGRDEEENTDGAHKGEGIKPSGAESFHRHAGVLGTEVLADEGGGGGANGKSREKAEGLDTNGNEMGTQGSVEREAGDESEDVGVDEPHSEHFNSLGKSDTSNAGHHFPLRRPIGFPKSERDFVGLRLGFSVEECDHDDGSENPGEEASVGQSCDAHASNRGVEENEACAKSGVAHVDEKHDEEGRAGVADGSKRVGAGIENAEDGARPAEDGEVVEGVTGSIVREGKDPNESRQGEADDEAGKSTHEESGEDALDQSFARFVGLSGTGST